ncbi:FAD binding domain protein [Usnea florida]
MAYQLLSTFVIAFFLVFSIFIVRRLRTSVSVQPAKKPDHVNFTLSSSEPSMLSKNLASALHDSVILPQNAAFFEQSMNSYWAKQESEIIPACVVRPRDVQQLCTAITILKREYDERRKHAHEENAKGLFAIRSGGHSPVSGAASINRGVLIDLCLFRDVTPSEEGSSVEIGAGAKWMDVSKVLDRRGLAVVGGRNSAVGVGGLTLGGGLSFFSPHFGLVCSNILSYEVVLASGSIATASESTNPDLWCALKGGSNNFCIVTRFKARSFPSTRIWSGFIYMPAFQAAKVLAAFHECVNRAESGDPNTTYAAAGPIACFSHIQKVGVQAIAVNLVHTKPPENEKKWPAYWRTSPFASLWRLWSTCKVRTLTSATDEMNALNPPGRRQAFATTTIKNDPATITAAHAAYRKGTASMRHVNVKGLLWTLVLQPLLPNWARKGDTNPLGLDDGTREPLVVVSFTVNWDERRDDELVQTTIRHAIEQIDAAAAANKTGHRYRYLNYCAEWQKPFEGYGEENWRFLQRVSRRYDPEGLFQRGCVGGFKLDVVDDET